MFQVDYSVLSNKPVNVEESKLSALNIETVDYNIENGSLPDGYHLVVSEDSRFNTTLLDKISAALSPRGFVLLVEDVSAVPPSTLKSSNLQLVSVTENNNKKYFLLKKVTLIFLPNCTYFYIRNIFAV